MRPFQALEVFDRWGSVCYILNLLVLLLLEPMGVAAVCGEGSLNMIDTLVQGFDSSVFCELLNEKFGGSFSAVTKRIPITQDLPWKSAQQLGVVKTLSGPENSNMPLLVVVAELPEGEELRERSSRIKQFRFARKVLDQAMAAPLPGVEGLISQGLFVFHDEEGNFRLSFVYGKPVGTKLVWSEVRRQSFYVEAGAGNKTFRDRAALSWSPFDDLKEAFSVEKLAKEFYSRLFQWYQWALSDEMGVTYPNDIHTHDDDREINEHIIRLITRLMFVWFLKQKHLVPDELFDPGKLKHILKTFSPTSGDTYYRAILQNLFFATLNSEIPERGFATQTGDRTEHFDIKTLYRYPKEFALSEKKVLDLFRGIPFLNGGLFECLDRGRNYYDGFSRNRNKQARVPNALFFDPKDGLIPLLRQYNFTIEENSPGDEEVALDPELLGKVFENLLGTYNPETEVAARKATGSFYTPREIVTYMVDESLMAHLKGKCGDEHEDDIRKLFADSERPTSAKLCQALDEALVTAKVLDPACGSGAFPMGVLLRMVEVLRVLRGIPEEESVYDLKLELIENCIYGADIQCIAVQISKLRFFISLVCEQKPTQDVKKNYGIDPLPNLETKFVAANTLIGLPREGDMLPMQNVEALKKQLWGVRHRHFLARSYQEKKKLRGEDRKLRTKLAKELEQGGDFDTQSATLMAEWDPYDQNTSADFLDPEWMFNVQDGFHITIGNPPYVRADEQSERNQIQRKAILDSKQYETLWEKWDLYVAFIERAFKLLRPDGITSMIVSDAFCHSKYAEKAQKWFLKNSCVLRLDFCSDLTFFEAAVHNLIYFFKKADGCQNKPDRRRHEEEFGVVKILETTAQESLSHRSFFPEERSSIKYLVKTKMLTEICYVSFGCRPNSNEKKAKGEFVVADLLQNKTDKTHPKPYIEAKDISRYAITEQRWIEYGTKRSPTLWARKTFSELFEAPEKIVAADVSGCANRAAYDDNAVFHSHTLIAVVPWYHLTGVRNRSIRKTARYIEEQTSVVFPKREELEHASKHFLTKYILAIMNSQVAHAFLLTNRRSNIHLYPDDWKKLPIPEVSEAEQKKVVRLVDRILAQKKTDPTANTSALEAEIDQLVYQLYDLTAEEIAIVEGSTSGSEKGSGKKAAKAKKAAAKPKAKATGAKKTVRRRKTQLPPSLPGWD